METCTLQQPQLWPGTLWWSCFFLSPSLLAQLPDTACFWILQAGCFWRFTQTVLQLPLQLVFLPIPQEFPDEGLSPVGTSRFFCCMEYGPWKSHSHCVEDLNDANLLEVASARQNRFRFRKALVIGNCTSATFQVCPGPQQRAYLSFKFPPTCTMNTSWTWLFRGDFPLNGSPMTRSVKFGIWGGGMRWNPIEN